MIKMKRVPARDDWLIIEEPFPGVIRAKQGQRHPPLPSNETQANQVPDAAVSLASGTGQRPGIDRLGLDWTLHRRRMLTRRLFFHKGMA